MSQGTQMLLVAAYQDPAVAQSEFDALAGRCAAKEITSQGMILVAKDADGKVTVVPTPATTWAARARAGAAAWACSSASSRPRCWPRWPSVPRPARSSASSRAARSPPRSRTGLPRPSSRARAVIIGVFPAEQRLAVEQALPGSPLKSVVESDEKGIDELTRALGEAMGKFNPDRTVLPIPDRAFGGVAGRTHRRLRGGLVDHRPGQGARGRTERAARPHRRRGLRVDRLLRRAGPHPDLHPGAADGRSPTTASTSPRCARRRGRPC